MYGLSIKWLVQYFMPKGIKGFQKGNQSWKNWKSRPDYSGENNPNFGNKHSEEIRKKISENTPNKGENHPSWKGNKVGKPALHDYVKKRLPKPELCQRCQIKKAIDLSNNGNYSRELFNWEWLCRSCHAKKDFKVLNIKGASNEGYIKSVRNRQTGTFYRGIKLGK